MTAPAWTADELDRISAADELTNAPRRPNGTLMSARPIWVVRVDDELYVRSWRGAGGSWFQTALRTGTGHVSAGGVERDVTYVPADDEVNDAVDVAYRDKYGRYSSYVEPMVAAAARATTTKLVPRGGKNRFSARREHHGVVLALILIGYLLIVIDVSILFAALPTIHRDLGFSPTSLSWAQNAYTLTFGGLLLLGARAGDLAGRRNMFMLGIGVFAAASLAVGLAQSPAWMITERAVQGVGAAILAPSTLALLSTSFPEGPQRTRAMAAYGALAGIATAFGLIVGGVLTTALSWRIGFFLNVPVGLAAILAAPRLLPETVRHAGRLNASDALSSTLGVSAVVFGIVHSAGAGWGDAVTVGALAAGLGLVAVFVTRQHRAAEPLLPLRLFADRERAGAYAARFLFNAVLVSWFFFMTQYLQGVSGFTPLQAGLAFLPVTGAAFVAAAATSRLTRRVDTRRLTIAACVAMLVGTALTSRVSPTTGYVLGIALPMLVFGIGQGLGLSTLTTAGMAGVAPRDAGVAGALVNVAHHLGGALGLGILITVFDAAGPGLADRVSASFTAACALLVLALVVTVLARPRRRADASARAQDAVTIAVTARLAHPAAETLSDCRA